MEANQTNNQKFIFMCVLACILGSCNNTHKNNTQKKNYNSFSFNWYNAKDSIVYKNVYELKKFPVNKIDSVVVYNKAKLYCEFKEKNVKDKGIYRVCNKELMLTHSFSDTINYLRFCLIKEPFLNQKVILIGSKTFSLKGKVYKLYHYYEYNSLLFLHIAFLTH